MVVYTFLPDLLALVLLVLMTRLGSGSSQREQIRMFVKALPEEGVAFPENEEAARKVREAVEDCVYRVAKTLFGKFHYIASGSVSGGSLIAFGFMHGFWWGGIFLCLWLVFFAWSMLLWAGAGVATVLKIELRQRWLSVGYVLLSVALKAATTLLAKG